MKIEGGMSDEREHALFKKTQDFSKARIKIWVTSAELTCTQTWVVSRVPRSSLHDVRLSSPCRCFATWWTAWSQLWCNTPLPSAPKWALIPEKKQRSNLHFIQTILNIKRDVFIRTVMLQLVIPWFITTSLQLIPLHSDLKLPLFE